MAVWEIKVVFRNGERHWSNVWHVETTNPDGPTANLLDAIDQFHRHLLLPSFVLERIVRRPAGSRDAFLEQIIERPGERAPVSGSQVVQLYNTVKILLNGGVGRPGAKLLRGLLATTDYDGPQGDLQNGLVSMVQTELTNLLNAAVAPAEFFVFGKGQQAVVTGVVQAIAQMRQEHRKRRKTGLAAAARVAAQ